MDGVDSNGDSRPAGTAFASQPGPATLPAPDSQRKWLDPVDGVLVGGGQADLFAHRAGAAGEQTKRHFVARIPAGSVVPPVPAGPLAIEVVALPGAMLGDVPPGPLNASLVDGIDTALLAIANSVRARSGPRNATVLQPHQIVSAAAGTALMGNAHVWWLRTVGGAIRVNGRPVGRGPDDADLIVLSGRDWIEVEQACTIEAQSSMDVLSAGLLEGALAAYLRRLLDVIDQRITEREAAFLAALAARKKADRSLVGHAAHASLAAVGVRAAPDSADPEAHELRYQRTMALLAVLLGAAAGGLAAPADGSRRAASASNCPAAGTAGTWDRSSAGNRPRTPTRRTRPSRWSSAAAGTIRSTRSPARPAASAALPGRTCARRRPRFRSRCRPRAGSAPPSGSGPRVCRGTFAAS